MPLARLVELDVLLQRRVRRVVGGDGVDGAVGERLAQGLARRAAERSGGFILAWVS